MPESPTDVTSAEEYRQLTEKILSGEMTMAISPSVARQFYTHIPNSEIVDKTGSSQLPAKLLVWAGLIVAPMLFLLSLVLLYLADGWSSALYIAIGGSLWVITAGFINPQSVGTVAVSITTLATVMAGFVYLGFDHRSGFYLVCFLYVASLWVHHMTYVSSTYLLRRLVLSSAVAYDMLKEHINLKEPAR